MLKALFTGSTGMKAQQMVVDTIANNLANVNTTGFKRSQLDFKDLLYVTLRSAGAESAQGTQVPTGLHIGSGVRPASTLKIFTQGVLENTGNSLDMAIEGSGFFQIQLPSGDTQYTRDGAFRLNSSGQVVNSDGFPLIPAITIPSDSVSINIGQDGSVSVITSSSPNSVTSVGNIQLAMFSNPGGLRSEGRNLYSETPASGAATTATPGEGGSGTVQQNFVERSNVEVVSELVNLIIAQRAYEVNSRAIRIGDEMLQMANAVTR